MPKGNGDGGVVKTPPLVKLVGTELNAERQWRHNSEFFNSLLTFCFVGTELNAERQWRLRNVTDIPVPPVFVGTELNAERQWRHIEAKACLYHPTIVGTGLNAERQWRPNAGEPKRIHPVSGRDRTKCRKAMETPSQC